MRQYFEKMYLYGFENFVQELEKKIVREEKAFVITANPETLMIGQENATFDEILKSEKTTIVPDGIGVVKAATMLGYPAKERVPGVEIVQRLLEILNQEGKSIYLLGAKEEVLVALVKKIQEGYPNVKIAGYQNGYIADKDAAFEEIKDTQPDVILVALGIPYQELLIERHFDAFSKGIFVGVGGSFDVLSGMKKRAPQIFIRLNIEWLYRILCEPRRIKRFYRSNIKFILKVKEMRKKNHD